MPSPVTSFLSQDYESLINDATQFAMATFPPELWTRFSDSQTGTYLLRVQAYIGDLLGYQLNASVMETLTMRVVRERNLRLIAQGVGYEPRSATGASLTLRVYDLPTPPDAAYPFTISKHHQFSVNGIVYQPLADKTVTTGSVLNNVDDGYYTDIDVREGVETFEEVLGTSNGKPSQTFVLSQYPVQDGTLEVTVTADGGYTRVVSFTTSLTSSAHYRTYGDAKGRVTVEFGNGILGKIPVAGQTIRATYRTTSTDAAANGNVPEGLLTWGASGSSDGGSPVPAVVQTASIRNLTAGVGGGPKESIEQIRRSIPRWLRTNDRAVTALDYGDLASLVPGVANAKSFSTKPVYGVRPIEVRLVPTGGGSPSQPLIDDVATYLSTRKDPGRQVNISGADYVNVKVSVDARLQDTARKATVADYITKALLGIFDPDYQDYGSSFPLQAAYDAIDPERIPGLRTAYISDFRIDTGWNEYPSLPTVGDGGVVYAASGTNAITREWNVRFTNPTPPSLSPEFTVYERVRGTVTAVSALSVTDQGSYFPTNEYVGWTIVPKPSDGFVSGYLVTANTDRRLETATPGLSSQLSIGDEFGVEKPVTNGKVIQTTMTATTTNNVSLQVASSAQWSPGDKLVIVPPSGDPIRGVVSSIPDGTHIVLTAAITAANGSGVYFLWEDPAGRAAFALSFGTSPWTTGDQLHVDTYARVADIVLRESEFPILDPADLKINIIGGISLCS